MLLNNGKRIDTSENRITGFIVRCYVCDMKKSVTLISLLFLSLVSFAQEENYVDGFVIDENSKLSFVQLAYVTGKEAFIKCVVREKNGEIKTYTPNDIKGYGFVGGDRFNSVANDNIFAKVMIKGSLSLWKHEKQYYLVESNQIYPVQNDSDEQLRSILSNCVTSKSIDRNLKNNESSLKKITISYNQCKNDDFTVLERKKPFLRLEFGPTFGLDNSSIQFSETRNYEYLLGSFESTNLFYGASINVSSPVLVEGLSLQQDVIISNSSFFDFVRVDESNQSNLYDTKIEINETSFPFSIKYSPIEFSGFKPYFQYGVSFKRRSATTAVQNDRIVGNVVTSELEEEAFQVKKSSLGTWFGFGVTKDYKSFHGDLFARFHAKDEISETNRLSGSLSRFSIGISVRYIQAFYR